MLKAPAQQQGGAFLFVPPDKSTVNLLRARSADTTISPWLKDAEIYSGGVMRVPEKMLRAKEVKDELF